MNQAGRNYCGIYILLLIKCNLVPTSQKTDRVAMNNIMCEAI